MNQAAFDALGMRDYIWRYPRGSYIQERWFDLGNPGLHGVSITVGMGEVVTIIGPNGCGKSTLTGIVRAREGDGARRRRGNITALTSFPRLTEYWAETWGGRATLNQGA